MSVRQIATGCVAAGCLAVALVPSLVRPGATAGRPVAARSVGSIGAVRPMIAGDRFVTATVPPTIAQCEEQSRIACYDPSEVRAAYDFGRLPKRLTGAGQTIVLVDSFGSTTIARDLAAFDTAFGIPAPPSLKVIQPAGVVHGSDPGWAGETTLDVEWSHAMAPGAKILLVETPVSETEGTVGMPQIVKAEQYVISHHLGSVISQSFGATEGTFTGLSQVTPLRAAYLAADKAKVSVLASTGDTGSTAYTTSGSYFTDKQVSWPSSDPLVTAVGGTELHLRSNGTRTSPDSAWNDTYSPAVQEYITGSTQPSPLATGGGASRLFGAPSYQHSLASLNGGRRSVPDVSVSAACSGSVDVYQSFPGAQAGWYAVCGTSEASPIFAGIVALADQDAGHRLGLLNPSLYRLEASHARGLVDVTKGNNSVSFFQPGRVNVPGYPARRGYDLATGVGTVDVGYLVPELAGR